MQATTEQSTGIRGAQGRKRAIIIGAGFGGLSLGIRLGAMGIDTTIVEALDKPGGRAYVREQDGFRFDMGPTVITVPHFIEELFALRRDEPALDEPDFPEAVLAPSARVREGISGGPVTSKYCEIVPIAPFYRIAWQDGTIFDYDGDPERTRAQIAAIAPEDLDGYERFHRDAEAIFRRGFLELGYTHFDSMTEMLRVVPDLLKLGAVRTLFSFTKRYFKSDKLRQVFSFETLLVGGNPMNVPAIYAMIHFVEKTWGIHYVKGGTGALVEGFARKHRELGGTLRLQAPVDQILVEQTPSGRRAVGVRLQSGEELHADMVISNADYATTYKRLLKDERRVWNSDFRIDRMRWSMSLFVLYFGFEARPGEQLPLAHHNILLGPRYEGLLGDIFDRRVLAEDFSQYLHVPTLTDPSMAPAGHHTAYTLLPVPNQGGNGAKIDWEVEGPKLAERVLEDLESRGWIPDLRQRIVTQFHVTPDYFRGTLGAHLGNGFGVEPTLTQSAYFRPHNRCPDIPGLYLVGASAQPGAGTPSVMMSAKMTARAIADDLAADASGRVPRALPAPSGGNDEAVAMPQAARVAGA